MQEFAALAERPAAKMTFLLPSDQRSDRLRGLTAPE